MARIRTVKPGLFGSHAMAQVPIGARLLFVGLFTEADDEGRLIDSAKRMAGAVFPHDRNIGIAKIEMWLEDLARIGCIVRYEVRGARYIAMPGWLEHQKISHPRASEFPPPPESFRKTSGAPPETFRPEREGEKEREGEGDTREPRRSRKASAIPKAFSPSEGLLNWAVQRGIRSNTQKETEKFINHYQGKGITRLDWDATWRNWMLKADEFATEREPNADGTSKTAITVPFTPTWE